MFRSLTFDTSLIDSNEMPTGDITYMYNAHVGLIHAVLHMFLRRFHDLDCSHVTVWKKD